MPGIKVIMLDFDGVLNSHQTFLMKKGEDPPGASSPREADFNRGVHNLDAYNIWNLNFILKNVPEMKIVISSAWRMSFDMDVLRDVLAHFGVNREVIIDKTPKKMSSVRCEEIGMWLHDFHGVVADYVVIDDRRVFDDGSPRRAKEYNTSPFTGLTYPDACAVIRRFKPEWKQPVILM